MIQIVRRRGIDDGEVVGRWSEEDGWIEGGDRFDFPHSEEYTEDLMVERFDGPDFFAVREEAAKTLKAFEGKQGKVYVDNVHEAPEDKVVHAEVDDEGDTQGLYYIA